MKYHIPTHILMLKLYYSFWVHLGGWCCEKAEFLPWSHHPNSSPLNLPAGQLHSLASGAHLNRETCSLVGLGNLLHKGKSFLCHVQLGVLPHEDRPVRCCSAASQRHRAKGKGGLRAVYSYLGLGVSFCHSQSLFCCFRQSRAFVTCVVPTWTDSTLASTVSSLAVLQRNIFTSTRRQSDTI